MAGEEMPGTARAPHSEQTARVSLAVVGLLTAIRAGMVSGPADVRRLLGEEVDPLDVVTALATQLTVLMKLFEATGRVNVDKWLQGMAQSALRRTGPAAGNEGDK